MTDCELTDEFRMRRINESLCGILSEHHTFEPAMDASGTPVEGSYTTTLSYAEIRERMSGNICRCGAYANILAAITQVAEEQA